MKMLNWDGGSEERLERQIVAFQLRGHIRCPRDNVGIDKCHLDSNENIIIGRSVLGSDVARIGFHFSIKQTPNSRHRHTNRATCSPV